MTEDNNNSDDDSPELVLDEVVEVAPEELSDEQTTFLQENADDLSDEQKETFKDALEKKDDEDEEESGDVDPDEVEVETRKKIEKKPAEKDEGEKEDEDEDEEREVDPDDKVTIGKLVKKETAGLKEQIQTQSNKTEVDALLRSKPELGKYRAVILKYMDHPSYANIPAPNIAAIVSAKDQQKIGAQKEREATEKVKKTQGGGSSARKPVGGKVDWGKASKEEMDAKKDEIFDRR